MSERHHRRHHTWPHCGSELCMREPRRFELHVSKPDDGPAVYIPSLVHSPAAYPVMSEDLLCDDMGMPELARQPKRMPRLWFRSSDKSSDGDFSVSGYSGPTWKQTPRRVFRRLTRRPPLSKSRSLFVVPSNMMTIEPNVMSAYIPPQALAHQTVVSDRGRTVTAGADAARFMAERRHRRCHSEQPRAWRRPSATIWPLREQEE
ncbi:unnamed protein product [Penicillium salamii]|uniref:Uncharacterized protein n=1 Tax=Penicillium salamii TaxID=1612424 RepID=A0A9W4J2K0_9EURO|nr:unnamed protein product [Penicillium salamii]CAG8034390.1 unnamed protein product [Penicillium salamii]CAG8057236.1 unnamed protein product [Penicillium salamii]CAG8112115.1 unnamed protein product [Penicillium salamii]CAG8177590.1 unnamed protein product [Penicillium salamii]